MASRTIFPPIVNSFEPAFIAGSTNELRVYFSLSGLSSETDVKKLNVQAMIMRKDGVKVLNTEDGNNRYRATGIILNMPISEANKGSNQNYYFVTINNNDLKSEVGSYRGWIPGWVYKIQLRLSSVVYDPANEPKQEKWIQQNSVNFSEWSTFCYTKAIAPMKVSIPMFNDFETQTDSITEDATYVLPAVDFYGTIINVDSMSNEDYKSCRVVLYKQTENGEEKLEDSGDIFPNESRTSFKYVFKCKFIKHIEYKLQFTYITENGHQPIQPLEFIFNVNTEALDRIDAEVITLDNDTNGVIDINEDWLDLEEEEGRIGIKIYSSNPVMYSGNVCIRRSDQTTNFNAWEDIKIFTLKEEVINDYPLFYDYTIQSGIWYKYGVQSISDKGERGELVEMTNPIQRIFANSFLLGQDGKQLKLAFNNEMNSFRTQILESTIETIGSKYPFIARNAEVAYRTFPINGLISFWMDNVGERGYGVTENKLKGTFLENQQTSLYGEQVANLYSGYNKTHDIFQKDYTFERDFRQSVLDFLQDGRPKLFKSPTEGNIIVRLTDINCSPNQQLNRLVYSFSANAKEIADNTMENYLSYGFYNPGTYASDFSIETIHLGQLIGEFSVGTDLIGLIIDKYSGRSSENRNYGGFSRAISSISRLKITILDPALRIRNNAGDLVIGNNIKLDGQTITIYDPRGIYEFDTLLKLYPSNQLTLEGAEDGSVSTINACIDFVYSLTEAPYKEREVSKKVSSYGVGQFYNSVKPRYSIYSDIIRKYKIDTDKIYRKINAISSIEIEANPYTVFGIKDENDADIQYHEINETGILRLYELSNIKEVIYIGKRDSQGNLHTDDQPYAETDAYGNVYNVKTSETVMVTYRYALETGYYR